MHAESKDHVARPPRVRAGPLYFFEPNPGAHDPRRDSVYSTSCSSYSSDARDRNGSLSVSSSFSDYLERRGSNDSVFSNWSVREGCSGEPADQDTSSFFRKRKPRSLRNSFESLQLGLAPDPDSLPPLLLEDSSCCALTSQLACEEELGTCSADEECSCEDEHQQELAPRWARQEYGVLSPISEASSSSGSVESCLSPLPSPGELSERLWQGLLTSPVLSPAQPRRVRRAYSKRTQGCNCEKSKCLKLYCECFAKHALCGPECNCKGCMNTTEDPETREKAVQASLDRSTTAFFRSPETGLGHKGCRCKKSQCQKNYCECFSVARACTSECRCVGCSNMHGVKIPQPSLLMPRSAPPPPPPATYVAPNKGCPPPPPPPSHAPPIVNLASASGRLPPPPPPPMRSPNMFSLVESRFRKEVTNYSDNSMCQPMSSSGEHEVDLSSFDKCAQSSSSSWLEGDLGEFYEECPEAVACDYLCGGVAGEQPTFLLDGQLAHEPLPLESDYCPDFLLDALAPSNSR